MIIEQQQFIEQSRLAHYGLDFFFKRTLDCLRDELQRLRQSIYDNNQHEYIFALNERAWVGVFNNAVLRAFPDSAVTLQEFGVYNKRNFVGRADYLVCLKDKCGMPICLLFEVKQYEETIQAKILADTRGYLDSVKEQGQKYFDAEKEYYKDKRVLVIPMAFGWIRKPGYLLEAKKYFDDAEMKNRSVDFCSLYFEGEFGAWVYGKIYDART